MPYVKPWDKSVQVDKSVTDLARHRLECLIGTDPLYNIEFFGSKDHGFRCTLYSDVLDISWFSPPAANIYVCFQYLLVQILTAKQVNDGYMNEFNLLVKQAVWIYKNQMVYPNFNKKLPFPLKMSIESYYEHLSRLEQKNEFIRLAFIMYWRVKVYSEAYDYTVSYKRVNSEEELIKLIFS